MTLMFPDVGTPGPSLILESFEDGALLDGTFTAAACREICQRPSHPFEIGYLLLDAWPDSDKKQADAKEIRLACISGIRGRRPHRADDLHFDPVKG